MSPENNIISHINAQFDFLLKLILSPLHVWKGTNRRWPRGGFRGAGPLTSVVVQLLADFVWVEQRHDPALLVSVGPLPG